MSAKIIQFPSRKPASRPVAPDPVTLDVFTKLIARMELMHLESLGRPLTTREQERLEHARMVRAREA